jgi:DNA-binding NtrC family response regulator
MIFKNKSYIIAYKRGSMGIHNILVVDDVRKLAEMITLFLNENGYSAEAYFSGEEALERFKKGGIDLVIADYMLPEMNGLELLSLLKKEDPKLNFMMITAYAEMEHAFSASQMGANSFLKKPFELAELQIIIKKIEKEQDLKKEISSLKARDTGTGFLDSIIGCSRAVQSIKKQVLDLSVFDTAVLITGESGTGKEMIAKAMHLNSKRKTGSFIPVNCSAIPENLLESEFFGYVKGAFTGANMNKKGLIEEADDGTLFLDEIGDLSLPMQAKLLRTLQEKSIRRIGDTREQPVSFRLVSATSRDLKKMIGQKLFREDLFYRINVINIMIPPLRERPEDIPMLVHHFIDKICRRHAISGFQLGSSAMTQLQSYLFPGNVRELENMIEQQVVTGEQDVIRSITPVPDKPGEKLNVPSIENGLTYKQAMNEAKARIDRTYIIRTLAKNSNNKLRTAKELGISPRLLHYKIRYLGIKEQENP